GWGAGVWWVGPAGDGAARGTPPADEANTLPAWSRRSGRPCGAGWSLLALFALGAGELRLLFASRQRQERQQHGNHQQTNLHWRHAPSLSGQDMALRRLR